MKEGIDLPQPLSPLDGDCCCLLLLVLLLVVLIGWLSSSHLSENSLSSSPGWSQSCLRCQPANLFSQFFASFRLPAILVVCVCVTFNDMNHPHMKSRSSTVLLYRSQQCIPPYLLTHSPPTHSLTHNA
uniref:Uncharacterized protein n=1 Tax=Trichobilharzia regenti TaxID=157069 RepID=A0AA85JGA8_TRIRE